LATARAQLAVVDSASVVEANGLSEAVSLVALFTQIELQIFGHRAQVKELRVGQCHHGRFDLAKRCVMP